MREEWGTEKGGDVSVDHVLFEDCNCIEGNVQDGRDADEDQCDAEG